MHFWDVELLVYRCLLLGQEVHYAIAYLMANWMESPKYTKPQELDGHKIDDQSDEGDAAGSGKGKKKKHQPDEGDADCFAWSSSQC